MDAKNYKVAKTNGQGVTTIVSFGSTFPALNGFTYLLSNNRPITIIPKTLEQTEELDQVVDLILWLMKNDTATNWHAVETFLKDLTFFRYETDPGEPGFEYRLFMQKVVKQPTKIQSLVFGNEEYTKEEFVTNEKAQNNFKEFLKIKYHNFNATELQKNDNYTEYYVQDGILKTKQYKKKDGGYRQYLFNNGISRGVVNLEKIASDPVSLARNPQYVNSSLNFIPISYKIQKVSESENSEDLEPVTTSNLLDNDEPIAVSEGSVMSFIKKAREEGNPIGLIEAKKLSEAWKKQNSKPEPSKEVVKPIITPQPTESTPTFDEGAAQGASNDLFKDSTSGLTDDFLSDLWDKMSPDEKALVSREDFIKDMKNSPFRLARPNTQYEVGQINEMKSWLKTKFPDMPVFIYDQLIQNKAWGQLKNGIAFGLSKLAEIGTEYHEGYHAVSIIFTTSEERTKLYNEVRKRLKGTYNDSQTEEILAEEFREFMLTNISGGIYKFGENQKLQKTLFTRILDLLKKFASELFNIKFNDIIVNKFIEIQNSTYTIQDVENFGTFIDDIDIEGKFTPTKEALERKKECISLTAESGFKNSNFTKGSQWSIVEDLKGYPSHANGGVDLQFGDNGISFTHSSGKNIVAAHGLVLPKINMK